MNLVEHPLPEKKTGARVPTNPYYKRYTNSLTISNIRGKASTWWYTVATHTDIIWWRRSSPTFLHATSSQESFWKTPLA